jgi:hypothetical protein
MKKKYICACGLNCSDCLFYKKEIYETAGKLRELIKESQIDTFLSIMSKAEVNSSVARHLNESPERFYENFKMFNKLPDFLEVLDGIIGIQCKTTCQESGGCSMCGATKECATIKCVKEKQLNGCWECSENEKCTELAFQRASYGRTVDENFRIINEQGIEAVPSRDGDYYEWQRRMKIRK